MAASSDIVIRLLGAPYSLPRAYYETRRAALPASVVADIEAGRQLELLPGQFEHLLLAEVVAEEVQDPLIALIELLTAPRRCLSCWGDDTSAQAFTAAFRNTAVANNWSRYLLDLPRLFQALLAGRQNVARHILSGVDPEIATMIVNELLTAAKNTAVTFRQP